MGSYLASAAMRIIGFLLLALPIGFSGAGQKSPSLGAKPNVRTVYNNRLFQLATSDLAVGRLRRMYGSALRVSKVSRNVHDPSIKDTLWTATTKTDQLKIFSNKYNSFLLAAKITSPQLKFGNGIRVGVEKAVFCKAFGLPATFDGYQVADAEGRGTVDFLFRQGKLVSVSYDIGWLD